MHTSTVPVKPVGSICASATSTARVHAKSKLSDTKSFTYLKYFGVISGLLKSAAFLPVLRSAEHSAAAPPSVSPSGRTWVSIRMSSCSLSHAAHSLIFILRPHRV